MKKKISEFLVKSEFPLKKELGGGGEKDFWWAPFRTF